MTGPPLQSDTDTVAMSTHADLDALAEQQGHSWSASNLTVAEKKAELGVF